MGYVGERKREYQREWIRARREAYFKDKSCVHCGSTEPLELDHIDPTTKLINPRNFWSMSDKNPKKIEELAKCQVLCHDCHIKKTVKNGDVAKYGDNHYNTKRSEAFVIEVLEKYDSGLYRQIDLARMYGLDRRVIWEIIHNRSKSVGKN